MSLGGAIRSRRTHHEKLIHIDARATGKDELGTYIHESLHCGDWYKDEAWVDQLSRDMADFLWRLGYRKGKGESGGKDGR